MTAPMQAHFQPWSKRGCTAPGCDRRDTATVDGFHGRRCPKHAPRFDPNRAIALHLAGFPDTAAAYCRTDFGETA